MPLFRDNLVDLINTYFFNLLTCQIHLRINALRVFIPAWRTAIASHFRFQQMEIYIGHQSATIYRHNRLDSWYSNVGCTCLETYIYGLHDLQQNTVYDMHTRVYAN